MMAMMMRSIARSFATTNSRIVYRNATQKDIEMFTCRAIAEGWHVGPYDFSCAYQANPEGFFMGEVDGESASQIALMKYPNNSAYVGANIVDKKFRQTGVTTKVATLCVDTCSNEIDTIGIEIGSELYSFAERFGGKLAWHSYVSKLSQEKLRKNLHKNTLPSSVAIKSIREVRMDKVLKYDQDVFGATRHKFISKWIRAPGSFGWAAMNERNDNVLGYAVVRQVIRGAGTEFGLTIAPLFADDVQIARHLLKAAAEYCLSNEALPNTHMELLHPVGDNCGEDASQLMRDLEAELTHIGYRMYSNGVPSGRKLRKIYGIASPSFD